MPRLIEAPPPTATSDVTDDLHGVSIADPYRWLEDQDSPRTRAWLRAQARYARSYLDSIPGRDRIRDRVRELLDVETIDSVHIVGDRYFFRKRLPHQEQPAIWMRDVHQGEDQVLIDPAHIGNSQFTAIRPVRISPDGQLLLYEIKQGGERTGCFQVFDVNTRQTLADGLPRGCLRGFAFGPDAKSFYYVHQCFGLSTSCSHIAYRHLLGTSSSSDEPVFCAGAGAHLRLHLIPGEKQLGFIVRRLLDKTYTDFYVWDFDAEFPKNPLIADIPYNFFPVLNTCRILALTDRDAPNFRIVEVLPQRHREPEFADLIPAGDSRVQSWMATRNHIVVSYVRGGQTEIVVFDAHGKRLRKLPAGRWETVRPIGASVEEDVLLFEQQSFTQPIKLFRYSCRNREAQLWAERRLPFDSSDYAHESVWIRAADGTRIPMFLIGKREALASAPCPTIMTSYGGYGLPMTPQFSVFVAYLMERGCLFALPQIRGGSEFGTEWHNAAKRRRRQVAFDDFISAADWLVRRGLAHPSRVAIFGGSNSGLLVGAAMTQRPDLFRAMVCIAPVLDMLRYHLFDDARFWRDEYGNSEDPEDFTALRHYSPYHHVRPGVDYPATMIVSGDSDQNCNPLHARKMAARLQDANRSGRPVLLDYHPLRGHSQVLPLTQRIESLTDRLAFVCQQLELPIDLPMRGKP